MKRNYVTPLLRTVTFTEDIVTTSIPTNVDGVKQFRSSWLD